MLYKQLLNLMTPCEYVSCESVARRPGLWLVWLRCAGRAHHQCVWPCGPQHSPTYKLICENVCMVSAVIKKRESHFLFCTPHPCPEWGVSLYFEKCLPVFCVVAGIHHAMAILLY